MNLNCMNVFQFIQLSIIKTSNIGVKSFPIEACD
jgi:hypothetical protein